MSQEERDTYDLEYLLKIEALPKEIRERLLSDETVKEEMREAKRQSK